jgi:hypothetical protein
MENDFQSKKKLSLYKGKLSLENPFFSSQIKYLIKNFLAVANLSLSNLCTGTKTSSFPFLFVCYLQQSLLKLLESSYFR